ncbi:hypothetical protein E8E12_010991 [Didymella heteroderae]|uniref:Uncharacterized protein n=1 Tax=Didymella heteroderae TaxID=1769908 RepID=A0A9P4WZQ0_9PLEO|nr:hypothetical protein E8E12_010991 [Didymella heteroderae]
MAQQANEMQLAEILSDLVSLRAGVCDPAAALALVSARPSSTPASSTTAAAPTASSTDHDATEDGDADLARAKELVALHYDVRERCKRGDLSAGLAEARSAVERALG